MRYVLTVEDIEEALEFWYLHAEGLGDKVFAGAIVLTNEDGAVYAEIDLE